MNWDVEKTRSENCQLCILRRRTCGKTSLQLILSDSTTLAYEQPPLPYRGGEGGWDGGSIIYSLRSNWNFW